jgi:DNA-binding MarR family transcriptional regulator
MSSPRATIPPAIAELYQHAPYVGALLRMAYRVSRERSFRALIDRGFTDLNQALLSAFFYPPPHGVRPIDLAENANMTKQAMNYLISQLEGLGYMERLADQKGGRRLVYLTRRGWQVFETIWTAQLQLEAEWAALLGDKRSDDFIDVLRQLAGFDQKKREAKPGVRSQRSRQSRSRASSQPAR